MSESNNYNNQCEINQTIPGQNNQVAGRDFIIHAPGGQDDKPAPDNPNLITCPACEKYGVFRGADLCPYCNYSFLNVRIATQTANRQQREQGLVVLSFLALGVLAVAMQISTKYEVSFWNGLGWGVIIVLMIFGGGFWLWARFTTWNKFRNRKF